MTNMERAKNLLAYEVENFSHTIKEQYREDFFDARNADEWVRRFAEWLAARQRRLAEVRASND